MRWRLIPVLLCFIIVSITGRRSYQRGRMNCCWPIIIFLSWVTSSLCNSPCSSLTVSLCCIQSIKAANAHSERLCWLIWQEKFSIGATTTHNCTTFTAMMLQNTLWLQWLRGIPNSLTLLLIGVNLVFRQCMHVVASLSGTHTAACSWAGFLFATRVHVDIKGW